MAVIDNTILTSDVAPAISIDLVTNLSENIRSLQELLGIVDMIPMAAGTQIKTYTTEVGDLNKQETEGDIIPLTKVTLAEADPIVLDFDLYRKMVTAQDIQKVGRERAIYDTDRALIGAVRGTVKGAFYTSLANATGVTPAGADFQKTLANAWAALHVFWEDYDVSPIHFVNPLDVAEYLGSASITTQSAFGFDYVEDFLGLGTVVFAANVAQGTVYSTVKENLRGAFVPANGEVGQEFELTSDESGLVGITHGRVLERGSIESMLMAGVLFFAENYAGVFKAGGEVSA